MSRTLTPVIAGLAAVAAFVLATPKPAAAIPATVAVHPADAGVIQQVRHRYWRRHGYPYAYGYGYRPYGYYGGYRPYGYYRPYAYYGGPYGYYGGPYGYYGRPGISFSFGF
jgi:hypothetical protein